MYLKKKGVFDKKFGQFGDDFSKQETGNPRFILPKINKHISCDTINNPSQGLQSLQLYVHNLLTKQQKHLKKNHHLKSMQQEMLRKKVENEQHEKQMKKQRYYQKLRILRERLSQLQGEAAVQEKKLRLDYDIQQRMAKRYDSLYDMLRKKPVVDAYQNTDNTENTENISLINNKVDNVKKVVKNKNLLRKFRVAGYAVYFYLFFPKYSKLFRQKRQQYFHNIQAQNKFSNEIESGLKLFKEIKFAQFWQQLEQDINSTSSNQQYFQFEEQDSQNNLVSISFRISNITDILLHIIKNIKKALQQNLFDQLLKCLAQIILKRSFLIDSFFFQHQLFRLNVNTLSFTLNMIDEQELILMTNFIFVKLIVIGCMINSKQHQQSSQSFEEDEGSQNQVNLSQKRQLMISAAYLLYLCNEINFKSEVDEQLCLKGNIQRIDKSKVPLPALEAKASKSMAVINSSNSSSQESSYRKRTSIQADILSKHDLSGQFYHIDSFNGFQGMIEDVKAHSSKEKILIQMLVEVRDLAMQKAKEQKRKMYLQIGEEILSCKNILKKQIVDKIKSPKRTQAEQFSINKCLANIKHTRWQKCKGNQQPFKENEQNDGVKEETDQQSRQQEQQLQQQIRNQSDSDVSAQPQVQITKTKQNKRQKIRMSQ